MNLRVEEQVPDAFEQINHICREFRRQITGSASSSIDSFLSRVPANARETLFAQLLEIELRFLQGRGEYPKSPEYLKRFPQYAVQIRRAFFEPSLGSGDSAKSSSSTSATQSQVERASFSEDALTFEIPLQNRLGEYELIRELGRGGMGVVFEARHIKTGNRVALKTLPTAQDGQEVNADRLYRFRKEFRSLSEINHPNLVGMQTLEVDRNQWFFTMDLVDGDDFLCYVRPDGRLDEERLRKALIQLVQGLSLLHQRRIVHRDVKPSNVLVEKDGLVKILDFGLVADLQKATDLTQTRSGMFAGTPKYAAPEQMFGQRSEASDWYAVGVLLYEALAGEAPFSGLEPMEVLRKKQETDPAPLALRAGLSADLANLADGLLKRDPLERLTVEAITERLHLHTDTRLGGLCATAGTKGSQGSVASADEELDPAALAEEEELVLVGREGQLAALESAREEMLLTREPVVLWVSGLSGEGKSSLCETFLRPLRHGSEMLVLSGRCYDRESIPYKAIDCIIESLVRYLRSSHGRWLESEQPEDVEFLAQIFPLVRRVEWIANRKIRDLGRMEPQKIRGRAFYGLRQLLVAIAARTPLVILLDDLQWADSDSAQAWHELLTNANAPAALLIGSYRSDEAEQSSFLRTWQHMNSTLSHKLEGRTVSVNPLTSAECVELVIGRTGLDRSQVENHVKQLFQSTGGNPYFLDQLLEGLNPTTGEFQQVPLNEIVARRLERLPTAASRLLEVVAISGQPIRIEEAAFIAQAGRSATAALTHMRSERLVRLLDGGIEPLVDTWHDKVRETVLAGMSADRQQALHLQMAEAIESKQVHKADEWLESFRHLPTPGDTAFPISDRILDLCRHFSAAKDSRAFVYQWMAGEQAMRTYAIAEALEMFQEASRKLPAGESPALLYRFWMGFAQVSLWNKLPDQAIAAYGKALDVAPSKFEEASVYAGLETVYMQLGKFEEAIEYMDRGLAVLGAKRPRTSLGMLWSIAAKYFYFVFIPSSWLVSRNPTKKKQAGLAQTMLFTVFMGIAEKSLVGTVEVVTRLTFLSLRTGDPARIAMGKAVSAQLWAAFGIAWIANWFLRGARNAVAIVADPEWSGRLQGFNGVTENELGNNSHAEALLSQATQKVTRFCQFGDLQMFLHMHRHALANVGSSSAELDKARAVLELSNSTGNVQGICWGSYDMASALARCGSLADACNFMQRANQVLPKERFLMTEAIRASTDGFVRLQCSDYQGAKRLADLAWSVILQGWIAIDVSVLCIPILIEAISGPDWLSTAQSREKSQLRCAVRRGRMLYSFFPNQQPHLCRVLGRAWWRLGKKRRAIRSFEQGARLASKREMKYQQGRCLLDLAAVKESGREANRAEAIRLLREMESVLPRDEAWMLGEQPDDAVIAPEFDLGAWELEHGAVTPILETVR